MAEARRTSRIRVGVSACLLGEPVRWDAGHKRDAFLVEQLGAFVEWVPVCPELELGMGVPREPVRLERRAGGERMVGLRSATDWTRPMRAHAERRARDLAALDLCGYVFKQGSPSCGLARVKTYAEGEPMRRDGRGLFAAALTAHLPLLPAEEEGRLQDPRLRESFIERLFAYRRLRDLFAARWRARDLVAFHTAHKLQLMAHSPRASRELGRLVARAKSLPRTALRSAYERGVMAALAERATPRRHVNALEHCLGFLRERLDAPARADLRERIHDYGEGLVPLIVPIALIRHHVRRLGIDLLSGQTYLEPHPRELMLRNHV
jgi:uncharacterized protein YbgA (DUF1722 family)/uncharacterized protein YbbK (DUF523 family)